MKRLLQTCKVFKTLGLISHSLHTTQKPVDLFFHLHILFLLEIDGVNPDLTGFKNLLGLMNYFPSTIPLSSSLNPPNSKKWLVGYC